MHIIPAIKKLINPPIQNPNLTLRTHPQPLMVGPLHPHPNPILLPILLKRQSPPYDSPKPILQ